MHGIQTLNEPRGWTQSQIPTVQCCPVSAVHFQLPFFARCSTSDIRSGLPVYRNTSHFFCRHQGFLQPCGYQAWISAHLLGIYSTVILLFAWVIHGQYRHKRVVNQAWSGSLFSLWCSCPTNSLTYSYPWVPILGKGLRTGIFSFFSLREGDGLWSNSQRPIRVFSWRAWQCNDGC